MNAFLTFLEKLLTTLFAIGFCIIAFMVFMRYYHSDNLKQTDPWRYTKSQNTIEAYLHYLRECQSCQREAEAEKALDELQRLRGLLSRLNYAHLPERSGLTHPVFSIDGKTIVASNGTEPGLWYADTGEYVRRSKEAFGTPFSLSSLEGLAYSPEGRRIAAGTSGQEGGYIVAWNEANGAMIGNQFIEGFDVKRVEFAPRGFQIAWLAQGPMGVWEPSTRKFLRAVHEGATDLAYYRTESGKILLLTASGREVWSWNPATLELVRQVRLNTDRPLLGLSRDGQVVAFSDGRVMELWDTRAAMLIASLRDVEGEILSFCRDTTTGWLAVGARSGMLYVWNPASSQLPLGYVPAHEGQIDQLACSSSGRAASVSWDGMKIWNLEKIVQSQTVPPSR